MNEPIQPRKPDAEPVPKAQNRTLFDLFGLTEASVKDVVFPVNVNPGPMTPVAEPAFAFQQDQVRRLLMWIGGIAGRNLLITGPTGCGKSSLVEQLCARLGKELYRVPCHGKLEFGELTGQLTVLSDGSTKFVHGPLPRAMVGGAVLLLDEMNFIHPSAVGALNTVLDGGPLLIPETGEVVQPHADFRIVATGNALDHGDDTALYRGTQRMNLALIQRFLTLRADYLSPTDEAAMLHRLVPTLPGKVVGLIVEIATDVRKAFKAGDIESTISTRTLVKWARVMNARLPVLIQRPEDELKFALQFVLTDGLKAEDARAIVGAADRRAAGLDLSPHKGGGHSDVPRGTGGVPALGNPTTLSFAVNPDRENKGIAAYWVGIDPVSEQMGFSLNGLFEPELEFRRPVKGKDSTWLSRTLNEKRTRNGYQYFASIRVEYGNADAIARAAIVALHAIIAKSQLEVPCGSPEARAIAQDIASQMGYTNVVFKAA